MLDWLRQMPEPKQVIIPAGFWADIHWWHKFISEFNGVWILPPSHWSPPDHVLSMDASTQVSAGLCEGEYFRVQFPSHFQAQPLEVLEAATLMVCLKLWGHRLRGRRLKVICKNTPTLLVINNMRSPDPNLLAIAREITYTAARFEMEIRA